MTQFAKFKLSKEIILKLFALLKQTLKLNKEMDNQEELYIAFDTILLSFYDLLEEMKK